SVSIHMNDLVRALDDNLVASTFPLLRSPGRLAGKFYQCVRDRISGALARCMNVRVIQTYVLLGDNTLKAFLTDWDHESKKPAGPRQVCASDTHVFPVKPRPGARQVIKALGANLDWRGILRGWACAGTRGRRRQQVCVNDRVNLIGDEQAGIGLLPKKALPFN